MAVRNRRRKSFRDQFDRLPKRIQEKCQQTYELFLKNPALPALDFKPLNDTSQGQHLSGSWSVRPAVGYRAICFHDTDGTRVWYWIGTKQAAKNFTGVQ